MRIIVLNIRPNLIPYLIFFLSLIATLLCNKAIGQTWLKVDPPEKSNKKVYAHGYFVNKNCGWIAESFTGRIWYTENHGETWIKQRDSSYVWVWDIQFLDSLNGWAVGKSVSGYNPFILLTRNGGTVWKEIRTPIPFTNIAFIDTLVGFAGGSGIFYTHDGGITWLKSALPDTINAGITYIFFIDRLNGWAVGANNRFKDAGLILKTCDGGLSWQTIRYLSPICSGIYFYDLSTGYIVGDQAHGGVIGFTNDGGETWNYNYLSNQSFYSIFFTNDSTGWVVGKNGIIMQTINGGKIWLEIEQGKYPDLIRIQFVENNSIGYIFGDDMTILRYDNGTDVNLKKGTIIQDYLLDQNYPNPFNSTTKIDFQIADLKIRHASPMSLKIYNINGQLVKILVDEKKKPGSYSVFWYGQDENDFHVASGVYIIQMKTEQYITNRKLILLR